jgi:PGF-pre-PGF domain-containing protein
MGKQGCRLVPAGLLIIALVLLAMPAGAVDHVRPAAPPVTADLAALRTVSLDGSSIPTIDALTAGDLHIAVPESSVFRSIGPGQSLQDAIDAAATGDTIVLDPGTYYEHNLTVTKALIIQANESAGGDRSNTIIDARMEGRIFNVTGDSELWIANLTLRNGNQDGDGGAIYSLGNLVYLISSKISNCTATGYGGAASASGGGVFTLDSVIDHCTAYGGGGALFAEGGGVVVINSSITNCMAPVGGALLSVGGIAGALSTSFTSCSASGGGAIASLEGITVVSDSDFSRCRAADGPGGAIYSSAGLLMVAYSSFTNCSALLWGGAIESESVLQVDSSTFTRCTAYDGGALDFYEEGAEIYSSAFIDSVAENDGGAIWTDGGDILMEQSRFSGCSAGDHGGAVSALDANSSIEIISSSFTGGSAGTAGGAIFTEGPAALHYSRVYGCDNGTAFWNNATTLANTENTWWGSNAAPAGSVHGIVDYTPWLRLGISAPGPTLATGTPRAVRANLTWNSDGTDTSPAGTYVPDGIQTRFSVNGPGKILPPTSRTVDGSAVTMFTAFSPGTSTVCGTVDGQTVCTSLEAVSLPGPTATPANDDDGQPGFAPSPTGSLSAAIPLSATVNIAGNTAAGKATVNGTKISGLVVTGAVQPGPGLNVTAPQGTVYQYFSLVPAGSGTISSARINFTVPQSWLVDQRIAPRDVTLYHRSADRWEALPTAELFARDGMVHFSALSPGLSLFAIAGTQAPVAPVVTVTAPAVVSSPVQEKTPLAAATTQVPVTTQTTVPPATAAPPSAPSPLMDMVLVIAAIGVLAGGSFMVRRHRARQQNPALFEEY